MTKIIIYSILVVILLRSNCLAASATQVKEVFSPYANKNFPTRVLFGDVHLHTLLSTDAGGTGTRLMPADAYRFARGEQILSNTGQTVKISQPLDFLAVADHTDGMGVIMDILAGAPNILADEFGRELNIAFNKGGKAAQKATFELIRRFSQNTLSEAILYQPGNPAYKRTWDIIVDAAEKYNQPGVFSTLIGFEWTSMIKGNNLHRVVLMRDGGKVGKMLDPFTATAPWGSPDPQDLWKWMEKWEKSTGGKILAIPHNSNLSNGMMFPLVDDFNNKIPLDVSYLKARAKWEPLMEVTQAKGDSETHPFLSNTDEFADFETWDTGNLDLSQGKKPEMLEGDYARSALKRGMEIAEKQGTNPYKFGLIGSSDIHTGLATLSEDNFYNKMTINEPKALRSSKLVQRNKATGLETYSSEYSASGLVAVWTNSNTRGEIFDAMQRKEAYATTGTRIKVRFFGGTDFINTDAKQGNIAAIGYKKGVPMGSDLVIGKNKSPSFLMAALKGSVNGNLDRIQIIKGWLDDKGYAQEKVYNVAWSDMETRKLDKQGDLPLVGNTVDAKTATWSNSIGATELTTVWKDPDFDPKQSAFYYARVLEIPTPRWTTYDSVRFDEPIPDGVPIAIQERAYTSPIWYTPQ